LTRDGRPLLPFDDVAQGPPDQRRILTYRTDLVRSRQTGRELLVDRVLAPDWVNVVALTEEAGETCLLCVRQWRFGRSLFSLEIPAGMIDVGESPHDAALRELAEETGYAPCEGAALVDLGATAPNPAFLTNALHTFFVPRAERRSAPRPDEHEELEILHLPLSEVDAAVRSGKIVSAMVLVALYQWRLYEAVSPAS
jgi:ADP-ribose pyrophosphatase